MTWFSHFAKYKKFQQEKFGCIIFKIVAGDLKKSMHKFLFSVFLLGMALPYAAAQDTEALALEKAKSYEDKNDIEEALYWYKQALNLNSNNTKTYYDVAYCQNELGQYENAIRTAEKGIQISPTSKLHGEYGYACYKLKRNDAAIVQYKKALALDVSDPDAVKGIADVYYAIPDYDNASIYYKKLLDLGNNEYYANYKLAYIMNDQKNYQKAVEYAQASIRANESYADAYNELGYAYSMLGQKSIALDNYKKASELAPENSNYNFNTADLYYNKGELNDYEQALAYYKRGLKSNVSDVESNYRVGWILNEKQQYEEAKKYLEKAVETDPSYHTAWLELGYTTCIRNNTLRQKRDC
jgi:tetratricopeptide (TPR) repeat protein